MIRAVWAALIMAITPIFACGAECGIVSAGAAGGVLHWNTITGTITADTTTFHGAGLRSYKCTTAAGAEIDLSKTLASVAQIIGRMYVNFGASLPSADCDIAAAGVAGSTPTTRFHSADSKLYAAFGPTLGATGFAVTTNTWYRVDFKFFTNAATRTSDAQVNGTALGQASVSGTAALITSIRVGCNAWANSTANGTVFLDEIIYSTTLGDYPIGAGQIVGLSPNADGTHVFNANTDFQYDTGVGVAVGATDTWNHVKVVPLTQITTNMKVVLASNTEYLEWQFADLGTDVGTINGLEVVASNFSASTTASKQTLRINDGGTTNDVYTDLSAAHTAIGYSTKQYATAPSSGVAWTKAKVDALRARWNSSFGTVDESPVPDIAGVMFEVDYIPSSTTPTTTDTLTLADVAAPVSTPTLTEAVTTADAVNALLASVTASDVLTVGESAAASQGTGSLVGAGADAESLVETAAVTATLTGAEAAALVESPALAVPTIATDSAALTESPRVAIAFASVADSFAAAETFSLVAAVRAADGPGVAENATATQGAGNQIATANESLTLTDTVTALLVAVAADSPTLADAITGVGIVAADGLTLSEFGQGVTGQHLNSEAMLTAITFTPRLQAMETTLADVQGSET